MDYENRCYNYSEKVPIRDRNYSYYMINKNTKKDNYNPSFSNKFINNNDNLLSSNMRMSNIESRLNTMEKMMKYFDEFIHLKEEEKLNNLSSLEITTNIPSYINDLVAKINKLEKELDNIKKQKEISEAGNAKIINNLNNKIHYLEDLINNNNNKLILENKTNNKNILLENENENENKKINLDILIEQNNEEKDNKNKNIELFNELIQNKLNEIYDNNKISEMLYLIEDINKIAEDNEFNINEQNENIRKIQNDNLTLIKIVAVHSEKINNIDYILNELTNLKNKYFQILSVVNNTNNEKDEEIFTNEFIAKYKDENKQQNENKK